MARTNTTNLNLVQPDRLDQYNVDDFNSNMEKIDNFAGLVPPRALTADKLTVGRNINGVLFDGSKSVITGLGLHSMIETYSINNIAYTVEDGKVQLHKSLQNQNQGHATSEPDWWEKVELGGASIPVGSIIQNLANSVENGIYTNGTEFTDGQLPTFYTEWLEGGLIPTITYEEYQTELTMTGQCWSVALDRVRRTFKVPFIKDEVVVGINDTIPVKGNGIATGFTDGNSYGGTCYTSESFGLRTTSYGKPVGEEYTTGTFPMKINIGITTDPTKSGIVADLSQATKTIKHFLIVATGSIKQSEMDWSRYMDSLNGKLNTDHSNDTVPYIIDPYVNGTSGYNVWSNGYCEQWGFSPEKTNYPEGITITYLKRFKDLNYNISLGINYPAQSGTSTDLYFCINSYSETGFTINNGNKGMKKFWVARGYLAQGEY